MLKYLRIRNLAVISDVEMEPETGLNLLTGETGSGKSIIVDAVSLLVGARASQDMLRTGASEAWVEGVFSVGSTGPVGECLARVGVDLSSDEMIVRRQIHRDGRTRAFINDRLVTVSLLRQVQPHLVDIHGQGDYQSLLAPSAQLDLLDEIADAMELRAQVNAIYRQYQEKRRELEALICSEAERLRSIDMYRFQIDDIERVNPQPGEDEDLERERRLLLRAEELMRLASEVYERLYEADDAVLTVIARLRHLVERLREIDGRFETVVGYLESARPVLEEASIFLREYLADMTASPDRLEWVESRLAELSRLKRKYGPRLSDVIDRWNEAKVKLERLTSSAVSREEIERDLSTLEREYLERARLLTERRQNAARRLAERVMEEMNALAMEHGRMEVVFRPVGDIPAENGMERVEFVVTLNPGEAPKPLARVASGGEISRLMLAIKSVATAHVGPPSLVFDEIDMGIGGRVAERVGERLKRLAGAHQVFCVTHQPQIARFADAHFRVRKRVTGGRAVVEVTKLDHRGRVEELARMMAGARVTDVSRRHARELLGAR